MYVIKNAFRSISRSAGRNILIGIIALVIAVSACIALSIKEAAAKAENDALGSMKITAQISADRKAMMSAAQGNGTPDKDSMKEMLQNTSSLSLEDYQKYSKAESVKSFYYSLSASFDAGGELEPVDSSGASDTSNSTSSDTSSKSSASSSNQPTPPSDNRGGKMFSQGDFTVIGYSGDEAMTSFSDGTNTISSGAVFTEGTADKDCIISSELATFNSLTVGKSITLVNPAKETETVTLKIVGIYDAAAEENSDGMDRFSTAADKSNRIYMSYTALKAITDASEAAATTTTDSTTGRTSSDAVSGRLSATYVFDGEDEYNEFCSEVRTLGLEDTYTVSSSDLTSFEQSIAPLKNLSTMSNYFLIVVFAIGAIILFVLNIFNIRERKYEIGVLTAIGMKKYKVALQFLFELFVITLTAIIIGAGIGAATSVPVTNALLSNQIEANEESAQTTMDNFGRNPGENVGGTQGQGLTRPFDSGNRKGGMMGVAVDYINNVSYSTDLTVILQLILVGLGLTVISSLAAVCFIMRYEPLKILTSRD